MSEAQQASTAAEQARNDAELDAEKLRTDLTNLRKQLEHAHGGYKHSPLHVKKIVAQLEVLLSPDLSKPTLQCAMHPQCLRTAVGPKVMESL